MKIYQCECIIFDKNHWVHQKIEARIGSTSVKELFRHFSDKVAKDFNMECSELNISFSIKEVVS